MKSIFLSMLAIAVLASCSKESGEDLSPPGPQGKQVTVKLTIGGTQLQTRAGGATTNDNDKAVTNLSVFGVDAATGAVVSKEYFGTVTAATGDAKSVEFTTSTLTTAIYVVANTSADLTTGSGALNVNTLNALKNATAALISGTPPTPTQTEGNVLMSGEVAGLDFTGAAPHTAAVSLNYIGAKIILRSVTRGATSQGTYNTHFNLQNIILNNVNTAAYFFKGDQVGGRDSYISAITTGSVRPAVTKSMATGMTGGATEVADYIMAWSPAAFAPNAVENNIGYWYVFENDDATSPTTLLIKYGWKENNSDPTFTEMYFPVRFVVGDGAVIEPGKAYAVDLTLNGDFRSKDDGGGSGGGGTTDPDTPVVNVDVTVTVTPVAWDTSTSIDKPFN